MIWCRLGVSALWTDLDRDDLGLEGGVLFIRIVLFLKIESCFAVIGYDCVSVGYKYEPPAIVRIDTHPTNTNLLYLQFTFSSATSPSFSLFREFFRADQGCLTFEQLDLLVSFHLPSKSEI